MSDQLDLPTHDEPTFATDEDIDRRLRQLENGLADLKARIPAMERELETLKDLAHPERHRDAQPEPSTQG